MSNQKLQDTTRCEPAQFQSGVATYGCTRAQQLTEMVTSLQSQVRLQRQRADRYRVRQDDATVRGASLRVDIHRARQLCDQYKDVPPPLYRNPTSEHGVGYNAGMRDMALAVLGALGDGA